MANKKKKHKGYGNRNQARGPELPPPDTLQAYYKNTAAGSLQELQRLLKQTKKLCENNPSHFIFAQIIEDQEMQQRRLHCLFPTSIEALVQILQGLSLQIADQMIANVGFSFVYDLERAQRIALHENWSKIPDTESRATGGSETDGRHMKCLLKGIQCTMEKMPITPEERGFLEPALLEALEIIERIIEREDRATLTSPELPQ